MPDETTDSTTTATTAAYKPEGPTALQLTIAALILGTSAGFTMYTRRAGSMLQAMKQVEKNQLQRNPPKAGPPTKEQWEKLRPRIDKDDFF
jgi:hypothetical protein